MKKLFASAYYFSFLVQFFIMLTLFFPKFVPFELGVKIEYQYGAIGFLLTLTSWQIAFSFHTQKEKLDYSLNSFSKAITNLTMVEYLSPQEFYKRFYYLLENEAETSVDITYLDTRPPTTSQIPETKEYYEALPNLIKKKKQIYFRRILRLTGENLKWAEDDIIPKLKDHENFSLALYYDQDLLSHTLVALSVQRIDRKYTFIVAMIEQVATGLKRDIQITSEEFSDYFHSYYDKLWAKCFLVLDRGELLDINLQDAKNKLNALTGVK